MIKIFFHVATMGNDWIDVVQEQINCIKDSGLYDEMGICHICITSNANEDIKKLNNILPDKFKISYYSKISQYELPALHMIKQYTEPGDNILYMHTKGISKKGKWRESADKWREYLNWGCIENYKAHISALSDSDVSGVQLTRLDKNFSQKCGSDRVYAGNYFWANGDYTSKLKAPFIGNNRWIAEGWLFGAKPKANDFHNLTNGEMITAKNVFNLPSFNRMVYDPDYVQVVPDMVQWRYEIINALIEKFDYKSYLEIGIWTLECFRAVKCRIKHSVDPIVKKATFFKTSDDFFKDNKMKYDLLFVDGLHTAEQVQRDIENALECLSDNGTIVCHDMMPNTVWEARKTKAFDEAGIWNGDCYKAWIELRKTRKDLSMTVIDVDWGCGIIRKGKQKTLPKNTKNDFNTYRQNTKKIMNVLEPECFYDWLEGLN